jgi:signal transduction histidine kinase
MTIRARLTAWYAVILFVSLVAMAGLTYLEFGPGMNPQKPPMVDVDEDDAFDMRRVWQILAFCGLPAALISLGGGWWIMRRALSPVTSLTEAAAHINDRNLREQLPRSGNGDELDRLTEVFNAMTARLDDSFGRLREFTLHASHELKTPLTILHGEMETMLRDAQLAPAQRDMVLSQLDEVRRLAKIVDGLTLLTKAGAGQVALTAEPVKFDEVVRDVFADALTLAEPAGVHVTLAACEPVTVLGDRHRLRQLLLNLADNAIKYSGPQGSVRMELQVVEGVGRLTVANTGKGIPAEQLSRVFEPFFRCDASHQRTIDGCGLGLSIARWIVTAHLGHIHISSTPGQETIVTVDLPKYSSRGGQAS